MDNLLKIKLAAEYAGVTERTIYNWIEHGDLKLAQPGYVYETDLRQAIVSVRIRKTKQSKERSSNFERDGSGRFRLLSGDLNGKRKPKLL